MYPFKFLGINVRDFKKKKEFRREWTPDERVEIMRLINEIYEESNTGQEKYYKGLLCSRASSVLVKGRTDY
jgi:hypothetical protein